MVHYLQLSKIHMDNREAQEKPEENVTYPHSKSDQEPITQVQQDSVITREDVPNPTFRVGLTLIFSTILFIIAVVYYGTFTP